MGAKVTRVVVESRGVAGCSDTREGEPVDSDSDGVVTGGEDMAPAKSG